ncbi:hypothetical protein [Zhenpiania hominis]|uniref:Uncharacterized protein n=1 Tax=Zhenpiania hominis TaxID=2763644 RepID=A0A923NKP7_9FIRM|nr:hypothetical protein [Zhenpiania hominis]MBC6680881.1 hypothetical protein [Zhenpiania hominis]
MNDRTNYDAYEIASGMLIYVPKAEFAENEVYCSNNYQKFLNLMAEGIIRYNSNTQEAA